MESRRRQLTGRLGMLVALMAVLAGISGFTTAQGAQAAPLYEAECSGSFSNFEDDKPLPCIPPEPFWWYDNNFDNSSTDLHLVNCSANPNIALQRSPNGVNNWANVGAPKRYWCLNTDGGWQGWGDQPAGYYRFVIENPRSANGRLSVGYFHAAW